MNGNVVWTGLDKICTASQRFLCRQWYELQSAKTCLSTADNCKILLSELQELSWLNLFSNQQRCCMSLHDHSSITITIEMPDSFKLGYLTYCAECHRMQAVQRSRIRCYGCCPFCHNRMLAAERQESTVRVQPRAGPPQATSSGWFSELLLRAPLSCHSSKSAADALCCLPPARLCRDEIMNSVHDARTEN